VTFAEIGEQEDQRLRIRAGERARTIRKARQGIERDKMSLGKIGQTEFVTFRRDD